jgi:deoxyribose-phosphate aldolase
MANATRIERAAGGLVVRTGSHGLEVLLIDDAYGRVSFPKGHVEPGESWEDAAVREVREETGIEARILNPLGRVEYPIERDGQSVRKQVRLFLMEEIDERNEPKYQAEEIRGAYFRPWKEAENHHDERGYNNWSWVFPKAHALWLWHEQQWEANWRNLSASLPLPALLESWRSVSGVIKELVESTQEELRVVAPELARGADKSLDLAHLPISIDDEKEALRNAIEHTLLKPEASALDVSNLTAEAKAHRFKAVCVNPQHVAQVAGDLAGTGVIPCTVVGFPLGAADVRALQVEVQAVIAAGALDVDMVIPIGSMREDDIWTVFRHVQAVCDTAHAHANVKVKVILEAHFLTYSQLVMACQLSLNAGADFLKTSTGFAPTGAKLADVAVMAVLGGERGVKAAGGIRNRTDALQYLRFGANRIGTSSGVAIVR